MRCLLTVLCLAAALGAPAAAGPVQATTGPGPRPAVGVTEFEHQGYGAAALASVARGIVEQQFAGGFDLVERAHLADLLDEIAFQQSGVTARQGVAEPGLGLNVGIAVFGSVARQPGGDVSLTVRAVDVASGRVLGVETASTTDDASAFGRAVRASARRLAALAMGRRAPETVQIPTASFAMGSDRYPEEGPVHEVHIGRFDIDRAEVPRAAYYAYQRSLGRTPEPPAQPDFPASGMTWHEAVGYCGWVGRRLPTEAEWELAARGAEGRTYPWGEAPPGADRARFGSPAPVAVDAPPTGATPEDVLHLAGNVAEWVADWYAPRYGSGSVSDPPGPQSGDYKVVRGGSYASSADELRATARSFHDPGRGAEHIGFRCAGSSLTPAPR